MYKATAIDGTFEDMNNLLYKTITKCYETGDITEEFVKYRTCALPKKGTTMKSFFELFPYYHMFQKYYQVL